MKFILLSALNLIGVFMFISFSSMGTSPNEMDKERFLGSSQFHQTKGVFQNLRPEWMRKAEEEMDGWAILRKWVEGGEDTTRHQKKNWWRKLQTWLNS
jgi:hypothetical protein